MDLFDYIYVDTSKIISVYSQLTGGVVELREAVSENLRNSDNKRKYDRTCASMRHSRAADAQR